MPPSIEYSKVIGLATKFASVILLAVQVIVLFPEFQQVPVVGVVIVPDAMFGGVSSNVNVLLFCDVVFPAQSVAVILITPFVEIKPVGTFQI